MQLEWVFFGSTAALIAILIFARVRIEGELSARGDPSGGWAAAFGIATGPFAFSGVVARGIAPRLEFHGFGRRFPIRRGQAENESRDAAPRAKPKTGVAKPAGFLRSLAGDPLDLVLFVLDERRRFALESLRIELGYGFRDIALTGTLAGALYALAGVLPRQVNLVHRPRWDGEEAWETTLDGKLNLWPGLVLGEILWYMLRRAARRLSSREAKAPAPGSARLEEQ